MPVLVFFLGVTADVDAIRKMSLGRMVSSLSFLGSELLLGATAVYASVMDSVSSAGGTAIDEEPFSAVATTPSSRLSVTADGAYASSREMRLFTGKIPVAWNPDTALEPVMACMNAFHTVNTQ